MAVKNMAASILTRLKNQSKQEKIPFQLILQLFAQEEFLRKLSRSTYVNHLILKGGMFIYTLTEFDSRPTRDIDFLLRNLHGEGEYFPSFLDELWEKLYTKTIFVLIYEKIVFVERKQSYENL